MRRKSSHRYSFLLIPIIYLIDSSLIYLFYKNFKFERPVLAFLFMLLVWFFISFFTKFYKVYRNTRPADIISKSIHQVVVYNLSVISFLHIIEYELPDKTLLRYFLIFNIALFLIKFLIYALLKIYRAKGGNIRRYIIIGYNNETKKFKEILDKRVDYGYVFDKFFSNTGHSEVYGDIEAAKKYVKENYVDVIFCSLNECSDEQIKDLIDFIDDNFIKIKFIPDNKKILGKRLKLDYFEYYPVLSLNRSPLDEPINKISKRSFDIIFSLLVMIFVLSWLIPILGILIKLESKGPVFFKQIRNGINYSPFSCYKLRSMRPNHQADTKQVTKDDDRITKVGKFIRKTSLDELPQFINVFLGDMSVVGPRPHMVKENEKFLKRVSKFMGRHYVKPGITGLAQVKGYRGEVVTDNDINNRLKYDLHYIENWSLWLDIKIIAFTVINVIKGEEKAY